MQNRLFIAFHREPLFDRIVHLSQESISPGKCPPITMIGEMGYAYATEVKP